MIYWSLFWGFLQIGCFSFGGAYGAIPLIRDLVLSRGWLEEDALTYMIAVSESTPGPIMVNLATYIGSSQAGFFGAVIATLAVVLPSFLIILLITAVLKTALKNKYFQAVLQGLKPCVIGIVLAAGIQMTTRCCIRLENVPCKSMFLRPDGILIAALLWAAMLLSKKLRKKKLSPIQLILLSVLAGIIFYS